MSHVQDRYESAKSRFAEMSIDTDAALQALSKIPLSIHCWQGDDVTGFENSGEQLSGGIQATGSYPGKARNFDELTQDFDLACSLIPGPKRLNLHASYAVFADNEPGKADRDSLEAGHFQAWVDYAKSRQIGLDFNPTFFSHPMVKDGLTLSSPDETVRSFWIRHGKSTRRISAYIAQELGSEVLHNIWIPDGFKDWPADRLGPRLRLKDSLDQILEEKLPGVIDSVESKTFGIGLEAYTVGSIEFYLGYAVKRGDLLVLLDNGHYHPTEDVSDKISALLTAFPRLPLHVTRPMRWDSDHVVLLQDEIMAIAREIVRCKALDRVLIGLDFFDASINRVAAWVIGSRSFQKALLMALLQPADQLRELQDQASFTELMVLQENQKTLPWGDVWNRYCEQQAVPDDHSWLEPILKYEADVLCHRK